MRRVCFTLLALVLVQVASARPAEAQSCGIALPPYLLSGVVFPWGEALVGHCPLAASSQAGSRPK